MLGLQLMSKPTLYLMLGYPGAGKTTVSKYIHELTGATHLWADQIRNERIKNPSHSHQENLELYRHLNDLTAEFLATGQSVIFDTAFNFYKDRQHLRKIADDHDAETKLIWVTTDKVTSRKRAVHKNHSIKNTYPTPMPLERFERISNDLEPPKPDETAFEIIGGDVTKKLVAKLLGLS